MAETSLARERSARAELRTAREGLHDAQRSAGLRHKTPKRWRLLPALVAIAAFVLAAIMVVGAQHRAAQPDDGELRDFAAHQMSLLLSPNYEDPERIAEILSAATGTFYDELGGSAQAYTEFVRRNGTVGVAIIDDSAVTEREADGGVVLVAATVQYTEPAGLARTFRLRVEVVTEAAALKVAGVQYLP